VATFTKINGFVEHLSEGVHNLGTDQLRVALSNTAPSAETPDPTVLTADALLANVTEIAYTNLDSDPTSRNLTVTTSAQTSGTYTLDADDVVLTASGGAMAEFRYIYIYNTAGTGVTDPLIGYYDYGSGLTLADGETLTVAFDVAGILTLV
jgi:aspartate/methionine/tyrosine aminotransferase